MDESNFTLNEYERAFVREHLHHDVPNLLLQKHYTTSLDISKLAGQILARQKARYKLPDWYANDQLFFPPPLSVEQGSSEATARFKASLVAGRKLIDVTGGMGIDCFYMSAKFERTLYFDQQEPVARAAAYNFAKLGVGDRIEVRADEAIAALESSSLPADWIYADPARRDTRQRKVAQLADCTPDLTQVLPVLFRSAPRVLVKTAPLLDIDLAVSQLQGVQEVYVLGVDGECKEVLYSLGIDVTPIAEIPIRVRLLNSDGTVRSGFDFSRQQEATASVAFAEPMAYLYEPHAAVLKAGAFKTIALPYGLSKLAPHTHLYTSNHWIPDFPGRGFEVVAVCKPDARAIALHVPEGKANLTVRNFPAKTDDLRKKWRLKEGGDLYLFAAELNSKNKVVIVAKKAYIM